VFGTLLKKLWLRGISNMIDKRGFTLIEVLVALSILAVGMIGISGLAGTAWRALHKSQATTQAINLAQDRIEALQSVDFDNLEVTDAAMTCTGPAGPVSRPQYTCTPTSATIPLGTPSKIYTWSYTVTHIDLNNDGIAMTAIDGLKRIDVTISWTSGLLSSQSTTTVTTMRSKE
jgi:type IV pilus modification protein PilV